MSFRIPAGWEIMMVGEREKKGAVLVNGRGVAGITAAVEAAEVGYPVYLLKKKRKTRAF